MGIARGPGVLNPDKRVFMVASLAVSPILLSTITVKEGFVKLVATTIVT